MHYKWYVQGENVGNTRNKTANSPQIVDTIEDFSNQFCQTSELMIFDEFGAPYKVVKHDLKNDKDLDNICSKKVLGKETNLFDETQIQQ